MAHKIAKKNINVDTRTYQHVHRICPRGVGFWHFTEVTMGGLRAGATFRFSGSYSVAKNNAIAWAQDNGFYHIKVGS